MGLDFKQTYEFKAILCNGEEVILSKMFPDGTDIYGVGEVIRDFLVASGYTKNTIGNILKLEELE